MQLAIHQSPRCGARTRRGSSCQAPAMPNGRCRMHGGPSPGGPKGNKNALKHGRYSAEAVAARQHAAAILAMHAVINEAADREYAKRRAAAAPSKHPDIPREDKMRAVRDRVCGFSYEQIGEGNGSAF